MQGVALLPIATANAQSPDVQFAVTQVSAGIHVIKAEVASNDTQRELGLMYRTQLGSSEGMVFVFGYKARQCMWMKNTLLPLSVAFIDEAGRILNIEDMLPQTLNEHCSNAPAAFALEMNLGWFQKHGIARGQTIKGLPGAS
jgi:uncharacterized membrane protein (UPF0127 family)